MATIYDYETGQEMTCGLQGSSVCDVAIRVAQDLADHKDEPVVLEDDDGVWLVHPMDEDGYREEPDELDADWF
jgi:hypothetical protein